MKKFSFLVNLHLKKSYSQHVSFIQDLHQRSLIYQCSHGTPECPWTALKLRGIYLGMDPTAPSLHIGNLLALLRLISAHIHYGIPCVALVCLYKES